MQVEFPGMPPAAERARKNRRAPAVAPNGAGKPETARGDARPTTPPTLVTPWVRIPQPDGSYLLRPGKPIVEEEEIGTAEMAKILGVSQRRAETICDEMLQEGIDWRRNPSKKGRGKYRIKRTSVLRLKGVPAE